RGLRTESDGVESDRASIMAHVLHPRKAVAPPFMQKRLSDLDLHQIARCAPLGWPMQTLPDIPRMTPKPACRAEILQRPWELEWALARYQQYPVSKLSPEITVVQPGQDWACAHGAGPLVGAI